MNLKSFIPPSLRLARARLIQRLTRNHDHYEASERAAFFRRAFRALQFNGIPGDYAEFGCCGAMTFGFAHDQITRTGGNRRLWAFDSFAGLPPQDDARDSHPKWVAGDMAISLEDFHTTCRAHGIARRDYSVVKGYFSDTLTPDRTARATDRPQTIALAYIDCDLYSSTMDVLAFLAPRLRHGMILAFDDYFCWSADATSGERQALAELALAREDLALQPYLGFGWHGMSFVVENRAGLTPDPAAVQRLRDASHLSRG